MSSLLNRKQAAGSKLPNKSLEKMKSVEYNKGPLNEIGCALNMSDSLNRDQASSNLPKSLEKNKSVEYMRDPLDVIGCAPNMSFLNHAKASSSNLLKPLERMKSVEFGDPLDDISNSSDSIFTTPLSSHKRKFEESDSEDLSTSLSPNNTSETVKSDDTFEETSKQTPIPETKRQQRSRLKMEENFKVKQEIKMKFIQNFVNISEKYSQFLEKKIDTKSVPAKRMLTNNNGDTSVKGQKERFDITKRLKYFQGNLRPYQIEGVTWLTILYENSVNGILADEMGLGKTIQIIALFCHLYERKLNGPYLVVAPLSTLGNWEAEFARFAPKIPVVRLQGSAEERQLQMNKIRKRYFIDDREVRPVVLCSYQIPHMESRFLGQYRWKYIVVDEGHRIKNPESRLSLELRALKSDNRALLTGTPLQNDIKELWALFNFLMPDLFRDIEGFSLLLELDDLKNKDQILANEAQTKVISTIHKVLAPFMLRREKSFVLRDFVPKGEVIIYCSLTELQNYLYRAVLAKDLNKLTMKEPPKTGVNYDGVRPKRKCTMHKKVQIGEKVYMMERNRYTDFLDYDNTEYIENSLSEAPDEEKRSKVYPHNVPVDMLKCYYMTRITMQNLMMMMRKIANHPYIIWCPLDPHKENTNEMYVTEDLIKQSGKLLVLDNLLPKLKAQGHKVLLFSTFTMFLDVIEEFLIMRGYNYRRLDGSVSYDDRNVCINDFQTDPNVFLFMLSTRAGGLGLNLTAADTVIFMDRDWNPMVDIQAQDRCHRIGQTKPVMIYSLIVKATIDETIVGRGDIKKRLEKLVIQQGKFKTMKKCPNDTELKELEEILNHEEKLTKIQANGLIYTDKEINEILDRTELFEELERINKENEIPTSPKN